MHRTKTGRPTKCNVMNDKEQIWQRVLTINQICREGADFDRLRSCFHEDAVIALPNRETHVKGRDTCVTMYQQACEPMDFHKLDAFDEHIEISGTTATVTYRFDTEYTYRNKTHQQTGREILVFTKTDDGWQMTWRTILPESRETESEAGDVPECDPNAEILEACLFLMQNTEICYLSTVDENGFPQITPMNNLRHKKLYPSILPLYEGHDQDLMLYLSTSLNSKKVARLKAHPKVTVCFCSADQVRSFTMQGEIEIVTDHDEKMAVWQDGWSIYYPNGPEGPEYGVLKLTPTAIRSWGMPGPSELNLNDKETTS